MNRSESRRLVLENRPLHRSEPEYGALICLTCNNGFPRKSIVRHLNGGHGFTTLGIGRTMWLLV